MNARTNERRHEVVGNLALMDSISTTPSDRATRQTALQAVTRRTRRFKAVGPAFNVTAQTAPVPVWLRRAAPALGV